MSGDSVNRSLARDPGCPPGWKEVPLTSVADIRFSGVDKVSRPGETPVRLCNYTDVYNNDYITAGMDFMRATATPAEIERFGVQVGDVIITKDSETPDDIGVPAVVDSTAPDLVCGYHLAMIRPDADEVDPTFLAKQLGYHRLLRYFGQQANGSTRYGLSTAAIANAPLHLPKELQTQQVSGAIMRLLDAAIAKTEAVIAKLKQVRAGLVHDLLTRGLDHNGELRDPIARPRQFAALPGGPVPKNWNRELLSEAADWYSGGTPERSQVTWWSGDLPFLTPKDMKRFRISDTLEHVTELAARAGSRIMPPETAFIVVRGMILAHTFPVCLSTRPLAFNQDIKAVRGKAVLSTRYLAHWFVGNADRFLRKATEATHGTKKLDMGDLGRMVIAFPPPTEQDMIVKQIELANAIVSQTESDCAKLARVKAGLSSDLLTGRVRVPDTIQLGAV